MFWRITTSILFTLYLVQSASAFAENLPDKTTATQSNRVTTPVQVPRWPYHYSFPAVVYGRPPYQLNSQRYQGSNNHRINGRNDWLGDSRMHHWNRVISDMVSDMFGDGAGDFEFDMKIKFKADGKGKGKSSGRANSYADTRSEQRYRGNSRGRGSYSGRAHGYQGAGNGRYGYTPYAPPYFAAPAYSAPPSVKTYTSYPPVDMPAR